MAKTLAGLVATLLLSIPAAAADELGVNRFDQELRQGVDRARASVLKLECLDRSGRKNPIVLSAVAIDDDGTLLTVGLRSPGDRRLCVRDCEGKRYEARWIAADDKSGLTLLQVAPGIVRAPPISQDLPAIGSAVLVVGNPFGLSHSVSIGNVSGLDRSVTLSGGVARGLIQFTAPVFPGDSGGLLADRNGGMIGIVSTGFGEPIASDAGDRRVTGIGFAIPVGELLQIAQRLREVGKAERGYLGVTGQDTESGGVRVTAVAKDSPAQSAGLKRGDVIVAVDGDPVKDFEDLANRIERMRPGAELKMSVKRGEEELVTLPRLAERKPPVPGFNWPPGTGIADQPLDQTPWSRWREFGVPDSGRGIWQMAFGPDAALLGVETQPVTEALAKSMGLPSAEGALVNIVVPGSPADRAGIRASDVIVGMDDEPVPSPEQLHDRVQKSGPGARVKLRLLREGRREQIELTLAEPGSGVESGDSATMRWGRRNIFVGDPNTRRIEALEDRVKNLEKRLEELGKQLREKGAAQTESKP